MVQRSTILEHVIEPDRGNLSRDLAQFILGLDFPAADRVRCSELSTKAQDGTLSVQERVDLEDFLAVNAFLSLLQSKARVSLGQALTV